MEGGWRKWSGKKSSRKNCCPGKKLIVKIWCGSDAAGFAFGTRCSAALRCANFQDLGHKVVFLIGDATTKIGDPTGKDKTRPVMTDAQIKKNAETYIKQASKILKTDKKIASNPIQFGMVFENEILWIFAPHDDDHDRAGFGAGHVPKKDADGRDVGTAWTRLSDHAGYDSVELKADVVLLGNDQKFNELFGRHYQEKFGQEPQAMIITKLLVGRTERKKWANRSITISHWPTAPSKCMAKWCPSGWGDGGIFWTGNQHWQERREKK